MTIQHHIGEDTLVAYAAGTLGEAWSVLVATHLALCPHCRGIVRDAEAIGGHLLEAIEPEAVETLSLSKMMRRLDAEPREAAPSPLPRPLPGAERPILPQPLRRYVGADAPDLAWKPLGGGVWHVPIRLGPGRVQARLLKITAGKPIPLHSHNGTEMAMVLAGSFRDRELQFRAGDVQEADDAVEHQPAADPGMDCICLAVIGQPLRFRGWAARLLQPFTGI